MRLIDAEALRNEVDTWGCNDYDKYDFLDAIDNAPTVELTEEQAIDKLHETGWLIRHDKEMTERPQGEWITRHKLNSFGQDVVCFECNKCGEYKVPLYHLLITDPLKVCPNCGADMRGDANG